MKNQRMEPSQIGDLKQRLNFIKLDQRLEIVQIPSLSSLTCAAQNNGCCTCEKKEPAK